MVGRQPLETSKAQKAFRRPQTMHSKTMQPQTVGIFVVNETCVLNHHDSILIHSALCNVAPNCVGPTRMVFAPEVVVLFTPFGNTQTIETLNICMCQHPYDFRLNRPSKGSPPKKNSHIHFEQGSCSSWASSRAARGAGVSELGDGRISVAGRSCTRARVAAQRVSISEMVTFSSAHMLKKRSLAHMPIRFTETRCWQTSLKISPTVVVQRHSVRV